MDRLGIIDWGIGGISIYKLITEKLGDLPITYLSDTGVTPYGKMSRQELVVRLNAVIRFLKNRGVTHLVIGCNAASTALPELDNAGLKIEGVIEPAVAMTARLKPTRLGVIGGRRTVVSGVYRRAFAARGIEISQRIAQPLSGMIESGDVSSAKLQSEAKRILTPLRNCTHILLACTHYPAISPIMREFVSYRTALIDPAAELAAKVGKWKILASGAASEFLTTGDPKSMRTAAKTAFQVNIEKPLKVKI